MSLSRVRNPEFMTHARMSVDKSLGTLEMCTEKLQIRMSLNEALRGFRQVTMEKVKRCQLREGILLALVPIFLKNES